MAPIVVAVAGGSSGLGWAIVDALNADAKYTPIVLSRTTSAEQEAKLDARVLSADYTSIDSLTKLFEENKVEIVISTVNNIMDFTPELNLIQAADQAKTTKRYIPNIWSGVNYQAEHEGMHIAARSFTIYSALQKTSLEYTGIYPGVFLDYYAPGLPSYVMRFVLAVDVVDNIAGIPGTGDNLVPFTHTSDVAKYTVALLGRDKWEERSFIGADLISWNEVVRIAEEVKGVKFDVTIDSYEKLEKGQITELPGHAEGFKMLGDQPNAKPMVLGLLAQMALFLDKQDPGVYRSETSLTKLFPEIKPLSVEEGLKKSYGAK